MLVREGDFCPADRERFRAKAGADRWKGRVVAWMAALAAGVMPAFAAAPTSVSPAAPEGVEYFERNVRPLLVEHCYPCHSAGAEKLKGDLRLDSKSGWQRGGASGKPAVIPGDPEASRLIQAVRRPSEELAMPPKQALSSEAVAILETWVRLGAPDPRSGGALLPDPRAEARHHWAFQPIRSPALPAVKQTGWVQNNLDRFVLARLESEGLRPAPQADRRTLLRRASVVLTGLLPTATEVEAFEQDASPEAFARVVDRLLASPRYGERWGRHWLDVARYADTKGYVFEEERRYPYAYTYRDWVIAAFNDDKPYDRFLVEQIAGDQVATEKDRSPLAALGFLTLGRRFLNNQPDIIDDRIDVVTRGTMALTVVCARCHDHKYDPVPSADYYSLYGVFASSHEPGEKPLLGTIPDAQRYAEFKVELARREKERDDFTRGKEEEHRQKLRRSVGDYLLAAQEAAALESGKVEELARSRQLSPFVVQRWMETLKEQRSKAEPLFAAWVAFASLPTNHFAEAAVALVREVGENAGQKHAPGVSAMFVGELISTLGDVAARYNRIFAESDDPAVKGFFVAEKTPIALAPDELHRLFNVQESQKRRALQRAVDELHATHQGAPPRGMAMADNETPIEPVIFKRGNPGNRGDQVPRQFLGLLAGPERRPFKQGSGRLEMAKAIASAENPLTARVEVNRVWLRHFGAGLVRTPSDFGLRSEPPSHPELLDWLASTFIQGGWSLKQLHRVILLSATWQQESTVDPRIAERDPDNRLWSHQNRRRLDFEAMRDVLLQVSGALDCTMGGHAVEITARDYIPRRSVYGFVERQNLPGLFRTFDFANPDTTSSQRFQTTVPQQALFFLNSPFLADQARRLMARPEVCGVVTPAERVARLYAILLQRSPRAEELALAQRFLGASDQARPEPQPTWRYGRGRLDEQAQQIREFELLPHFTGKAWQGGPKLPDPEFGWVHLTADGGHPGSPKHGAAVRRWTAGTDAVVDLSGVLRHPGEAGDGVRATVVSSRHGFVGQWKARHGTVETRVEGVRVLAGDVLDLVVDCLADENTDGFEWSVKVQQAASGSSRGAASVWEAKNDFGGPNAAAAPLDLWERYAQVLLMANETVFVD